MPSPSCSTSSRRLASASPLVAEQLTPVRPLHIEQPLTAAVDLFKAHPELRLIPAVDGDHVVQGAVYEEDVRRLLLSDFGPALLANRGVDQRLRRIVRRCPVGDAHASVEGIVNSYIEAEAANGIVLTIDGRYAGYLSNHAVLRLAAERELTAAREQNPLTRLPGNESIARHLSRSLVTSSPATLALVDFDHFKAFNDCYGFAEGDRAIALFAGLARGLQRETGAFVGHVGGDDFFVGMAGSPETTAVRLAQLAADFAEAVSALYSDADRRAGGIVARDRYGEERFFPLLAISIGLVHLPASRAHLTVETVERSLASAKQSAKAGMSALAEATLPASAPAAMLDTLAGHLLAVG